MNPLLVLPLILFLGQGEPEWIDRGRDLLDQGRTAEALELFEQTRKREPERLAPWVWVLRCWIEQGRVNDALDATDALAAKGTEDPAVDYLYGMSWFAAAETKMRRGGAGISLRRNILDSLEHLQRATRARPGRYRDAFRPLAKLAWMSQRLVVAEAAAISACKFYPADARVWHLLGRISHEQFTIANADPTGEERARELADRADHAYGQALGILRNPTEGDQQVLLSETWLQLGILRAARVDTTAVDALAGAVTWKPDRIDYRELASLIAPEIFLDAVERGLEAFEQREGRQQAEGAAYWWLGYTAFRSGQLDRAERAFVAALATQAQDLESAWYYLGRLRYVQQDFSGSVSALRSSWERNPVELFHALDVDKQFNISMIDTLADWCARQRRAVDATIFYELSAEFAQSAVAWQKLAKFLTAEGNRLFAEEGRDSELAQRSHLTAAAAFNRALELEPESPEHLLDNARHLHLVLMTDLARARELYERANRYAGRLLAGPTLDLATSSKLRAIRREAGRNLERLAQATGK